MFLLYVAPRFSNVITLQLRYLIFFRRKYIIMYCVSSRIFSVKVPAKKLM